MRRLLVFLVACSGPSTQQTNTDTPAEQAPAASGPQAPTGIVEEPLPPPPPPAPTNIIVDASAFSALFTWRDQASSRTLTTSLSAGGDTVAFGIAPYAGLCGVTGCPNSASLVLGGDGTVVTRNDYVMSYHDPYPSAKLHTFVSDRGDAYVSNEGQSASTGPYAIPASQVNPAYLISQGIESRLVTDGYAKPLQAWGASGGSTAYVTCVQTAISSIECQLFTESGGQRTVRTTQPAYISLATQDDAGRLFFYSAASDYRFYMYDGVNFLTLNPTSTGSADPPQRFGNQVSFVVGTSLYSVNNGALLPIFTDDTMTSSTWKQASDGSIWLDYQTGMGRAFAATDGSVWRKFVPSTTATAQYQAPVLVNGEYLVAYQTAAVCGSGQMGLRVDAFNPATGGQRNVWRKDTCSKYFGPFTVARDGTVMILSLGACVHRFAASGTNIDGASTEICPPVANVNGALNPAFTGLGGLLTADPSRNGAWYFVRTAGVDANASFNLQFLPTTGAPGATGGPFLLNGDQSVAPFASGGQMFASSRSSIYQLTNTGALQMVSGTTAQAKPLGTDDAGNLYVQYPRANGKSTFAQLGAQDPILKTIATDLDTPSKLDKYDGKAWIMLSEAGFTKGSLLLLGNAPTAIFEHADVFEGESLWKHGYTAADNKHVFYHVTKGVRVDIVDSHHLLAWTIRANDDLLVALFEDTPGKLRIYKHPLR